MKINDAVMSRQNILWLGALSLMAVAIFYPGLHISYYSDDFKNVFDMPSSHILSFFLHQNPNSAWYRPFESGLLALIQTYDGLNTFPLHTIVLSLHVFFVWFIFAATLRLGFSRLQAMLSSLYMLFCQVNVMAVLSNDTFSQALGAFSGCLSLWLLYRFINFSGAVGEIPVARPTKLYWLSILLFAVSLLSKETSISFLIASIVIVLFNNMNKSSSHLSFQKTIRLIFPFVAVTLIYITIHLLIVTRHTAERYDMAFGFNIVKNVGMSIFAAFLPFSTATVFEFTAQNEYYKLAVIVMITFIFMTMVAYGLRHIRKRGIITLLIILTISNLFPMMLMKHVSELYLYNSMPFFSILVGISLGALIEQSEKRKFQKGAIVFLMAILLITNIAAIRSKTELMNENGSRTSDLLNQIAPFVSKVPANGKLFLVNPPEDKVEYSVFLIKGFNVLDYGLHRIYQISGRNDFSIQIIEQANLRQYQHSDRALFLLLDKSKVYQLLEIIN